MIDLAHALDVLNPLDAATTVALLGRYLAAANTPISRAQAEERMFGKLERPRFLADVRPLLTADEAERFDHAASLVAFAKVFTGFIRRFPGAPWARTPEMIERHKLEELLG